MTGLFIAQMPRASVHEGVCEIHSC